MELNGFWSLSIAVFYSMSTFNYYLIVYVRHISDCFGSFFCTLFNASYTSKRVPPVHVLCFLLNLDSIDNHKSYIIFSFHYLVYLFLQSVLRKFNSFFLSLLTSILQVFSFLHICCANQLTGFYMRATLALNGLNFFTK